MSRPSKKPKLVAAIALLAASPVLALPSYSGGVIATAHPLASAAGKEMLARGGNAIDAAVAAAFVLAVVAPYYNGLGGGGFAVAHLAGTGEDLALDFREVAPHAASRDMYAAASSIDGSLAIAVPGAVAGYEALHRRGGRLPWKVLMAPAIRAATEGFLISPRYRELATLRRNCLASDTEAASIFLRRSPEAPTVPELGERLRQPRLAATLKYIAASGARAFYRGPIAAEAVRSVRAKGGILDAKDFASFTVRWRTPLEGKYRGSRFVTMPPPSAGGVLMVQVFGILETMNLPGPGVRSIDGLHAFIEALKLASAERAKWLGDPDQTKVPLGELTSSKHIIEMAGQISLERARPASELSDFAPIVRTPGSQNTTHISVIDRHGNAVALTTTINHAFGSCVVAGSTGVLMNNEMDDFATRPGKPNGYGQVTGEANAVASGRIPLSSMTPTLVFFADTPHRVRLAVGSPGGTTIPTTVVQVISNVLDCGLDIGSAVARGRIHNQWLPDEVLIDQNGIDPATKSALALRGHQFRYQQRWGDAEAVLFDAATGLFTAASDPRNEGEPRGLDP